MASCKNHSNVKLTWEENDPNRYKFLTKWLTDEKVDEIDYKDYIASDSSSNEEDEGTEELERKWALLGLDKSDSDSAGDSDVDWMIGVTKWKLKTDEEGRDITIKF